MDFNQTSLTKLYVKASSSERDYGYLEALKEQLTILKIRIENLKMQKTKL